ncbi:MAG: sigma-E processing peptidase SpoIIGA [Clostridia bacterium]|nr:sigma-E processing peptidase SpoIIGA [Clostridia bacterium]
MEIYIEYAFIENFALDAFLCYFAFKILRLPIKKSRVALSACMGAIFAVIYPFLTLSALTKMLGAVVKLGFPFFSCFLGFNCKIHKKDVSRYVMSVISYYAVSFAFAGGVYAFCGLFQIDYAFGDGIYVGVPIATVCAVVCSMALAIKKLIKAVYRRRAVARFIYSCKLTKGNRQVRADGYLDSGNLAKKSGVPVCFLSAELFFDVFGAKAFEEGEDELLISTVSGEKRIKLFVLDELLIYFEKEKNIVYKPYCAVSPALQGKEYKLLFGAWATDGLKE